jgi:hypothetical protein
MPANACRWTERTSASVNSLLQIGVKFIRLGDALGKIASKSANGFSPDLRASRSRISREPPAGISSS